MLFEYKLYDFQNIEELTEMYEQCFGIKPTKNYFKWKYLDNPSGRAVAFVAIHNNQVAAFYGVIPEFYIIGGKKEVIYQSMDTMTHPNFRRLGLFTKLANMTYDYIRNNDGRLYLVGFPGETSYGGFIKKLNWSTLIELRFLFTYKMIHKLKTIFNGKSSGQIEPISLFDSEFDQYFDQKEKSEKPISKYVDRTIANWRFIDCPIMKYFYLKVMENDEIKGYVVYNIDKKNRAFIVNLDFGKSEWSFLYLKDVFRYLFSEINVNAIYTFQSSSHTLKKALKKNVFLSNPISKGPFSYRIPLIVYGDKRINDINFFDYQNWDIQPLLRDY